MRPLPRVLALFPYTTLFRSVEGVFDVSAYPAIVGALAEQGIEPEDGILILRREVAAEGRNRAWINGAASTANLVGEIGRQLLRSEEHTSELQSRENLVCRLL